MSDQVKTMPNVVTDLWSQIPALMFRACEQGVAMEMEIADAVMTAAREIGAQQMGLVKAMTTAGVVQATAADRNASGVPSVPMQELGGEASQAFDAIARSMGKCSRRILEANQQCMLGSFQAMTGGAGPTKSPEPPRRTAA